MTISRDQVIEAVQKIKFPDPLPNAWYEWSSADGFGFLGTAQFILDLPFRVCLNAIRKRNYTLWANAKIHGTDTTPDTVFTYTCWPSFLLLNTVGAQDVDLIYDRLDMIGTYPDSGMMRYCDTEIDRIIPNVTACAALIYSHRDPDRTQSLVDVLRANQEPNGNWSYVIVSEGRKTAQEDSFHLAMMIHLLREVERVTNIDCSDMVAKAVACLTKACSKGICAGRLGWGWGTVYAAADGIDQKLANEARRLAFTEGLRTLSFRGRGYSAYFLARGVTQ